MIFLKEYINLNIFFLRIMGKYLIVLGRMYLVFYFREKGYIIWNECL